MSRPYTLACLVVLLSGAALRLANVNNVVNRTPDERVYTFQAVVLLDQGVEGSRSLVAGYLLDPVQRLYPTPTRVGYSALLATVMRLAGVRRLSTGAWLSCVASIAALGLTMLIGYRFFHPWVGLIAGLFLSVFPPELVLARRTWQEAVINFLTLLLMYCVLGIRRNPSFRWRYVALAGVGGLLLVTKEYGAMILGLGVLWAGGALLWRKQWQDALFLAGSALVGVAAAAITITVAVGGLDVWLRVFSANVAANATNSWALKYCTGPGYLMPVGFWILSPLVTLLAALGVTLALLRRGSLLADRNNGFGLAAFTLLFGAIPVVLPHWLNLRYVSVLNSPLCLLAALAACQIWQWARASVPEREVRPALAVACLALVIGAAGDYRRFYERYIQTETADLAIRMVLDFPR